MSLCLGAAAEIADILLRAIAGKCAAIRSRFISDGERLVTGVWRAGGGLHIRDSVGLFPTGVVAGVLGRDMPRRVRGWLETW
jgi:hypothetical protein